MGIHLPKPPPAQMMLSQERRRNRSSGIATFCMRKFSEGHVSKAWFPTWCYSDIELSELWPIWGAFGCLRGLSLKENAGRCWFLSFCSPVTLGAVIPFRGTQCEGPSQAQSSVASSHWVRPDHLGTPNSGPLQITGVLPHQLQHPASWIKLVLITTAVSSPTSSDSLPST